MLVICNSILKREIEPIQRHFSIEDIRKAAIKAKHGLAVSISGPHLSGSRLLKLYLTGRASPGRMILLFQVHKQWYIPALIRLKNDKKIGENMTVKNPFFKNRLLQNLLFIKQDLDEGKIHFVKLDA